MEYQHGGDIYSQLVTMDFSANINPLGLPKGVRAELARCLSENICSIYPDSSCRRLREALGAVHQVPEDWITCGNGAADLIFGLMAAIKPSGGLVTEPSFSEYAQAMKAAGCEIISHKLEEKNGFRLDIEKLCDQLERVKCRCQAAFLCNPNNPTGLPIRREEVEQAARVCRSLGILLVVDECFCDFLEKPEEYSVIPLLGQYDNLLVLKAFTKWYAMAGLRLGYGLCSDRRLHEKLAVVRQPWSVSGLAQRAGLAALKEYEYEERTKALFKEERPRFRRELEELGFLVYPSMANYLFFRDGVHEPGWLYKALLKQRVLIRSCGNYPGLDGSYYRICIKTREENEAFTAELTKLLNEEEKPWQKRS